MVVHDGQSRQGRVARGSGSRGDRTDGARPRPDPQRRPRRAVGCGEDDAGRGPPRAHRHDPPGGQHRRGQHGLRPRPRGRPPAALGRAGRRSPDPGPARRRHEDQPDRHPRLRRLRRRAARGAARRRRRAVRRARLGRPGGRDRPRDGHPVGGVRGGRDAARRRRRPVRPPARGRRGDDRRLPGRLRRRRRAALPAAAGGRERDRALRADQPDPGGRGAARRRRRPRHPARGDHRAVRGRDAHGALPRRRGDRHRDADRRPGDRRRPRLLPPGRAGVRDGRGRAGRPAGGAGRRVPVAAGAPAAPGLRDRRLRAAPADRGPGRAARGRGRPHLRGRLRRPGLAGAGVLRDAASGDVGARQRARPAAGDGRERGHGRRWPRHRRAPRARLRPARRAAARGRGVRRGRHRRADQARAPPRPATPSRRRRTRCCCRAGTCPTRCCRSRSSPAAAPTKTRWAGR